MKYSYSRNVFTASLVLVSLLLGTTGKGFSQGAEEGLISTPMEVYFLKFPSENVGLSRGVLLLQLSYDKMRFLKIGDEFVAKYEFSVELLDGSDEIVERKYWDQEFKLTSFEETLVQSVIFLEPIEFELRAGFYKYNVEMTDFDSKKAFSSTDQKILPAYWANIVGFSDVLYSYGTGQNELLANLIPFADDIGIDYNKGFSVKFQLFSADLKPFDISWKLVRFNNNSQVVMSDSIRLQPTQHTMDYSIPITGDVVPSGTYLLQGKINHPDRRQTDLLQRIRIIWINIPISSFDIDKSISQMKHLLSSAERSGALRRSAAEREIFFREYWKEKDPTPETSKNELLEEYFRRVEYSIDKFSFEGVPGWDTPRGRVHCIYGMPDSREKYQSNPQRIPQEIWTYSTARKIFIFADYNRTGEYVLESEDIIR